MEHTRIEQEFEAAFEAHSDELFLHCHLRISDRERALELTQETFLRAWKHVVVREEVRNYRAFLYRILNNLIIDEYRKRKTQSLEALLEKDEEGAREELLKDDFDHLESAMQRFDAAQAAAFLRQLPEPYQAVLSMRYLDGFSPGEIAKHLNESENTVSVRIHRGLRRLRDMMPEEQSQTSKVKRQK